MTNISAAAAAARENARATNGQFGEQSHSAPDTYPDHANADAPEVVVEVPVSVLRFGLPSKRHRKEQLYQTPGTLRLAIPEATLPPASTWATTELADYETGHRVTPTRLVPINGRWCVPTGQTPTEYADTYLQRYHRRDLDTDQFVVPQGSVTENARHMSTCAVVDGEVWESVNGEPGYEVATFGLGGDGTALFRAVISDEQIHPEGGGPAERYVFAASERDQAIAFATDVATKRGDTKSLGGEFERTPTWQLGADAPATEIRRAITFPEIPYAVASGPDDARSGQTAAARDMLEAVHTELAQLGVRDANGQIDWSRVDPSDRQRYRDLLIQAYG